MVLDPQLDTNFKIIGSTYASDPKGT